MRNGFTETAAWSPSSNFYRMKAWGGGYVAKSVANKLTTTKRIVTEKVEKDYQITYSTCAIKGCS